MMRKKYMVRLYDKETENIALTLYVWAYDPPNAEREATTIANRNREKLGRVFAVATIEEIQQSEYKVYRS